MLYTCKRSLKIKKKWTKIHILNTLLLTIAQRRSISRWLPIWRVSSLLTYYNCSLSFNCAFSRLTFSYMARQASSLPSCVIHPIISKMAADMTTKIEAKISIETMKRRRLHRTRIFKLFAEVSRWKILFVAAIFNLFCVECIHCLFFKYQYFWIVCSFDAMRNIVCSIL